MEAAENEDAASQMEEGATHGEMGLSDDEQERQRFKVAPAGKMPKRHILGSAAAISLANGSAIRPPSKPSTVKAGAASAEMAISGGARKKIKV